MAESANKPSSITAQDAPAAVGPYSQAVRAGDFVFVSGQIGMVPATGELVSGDVRDQARQVLENLSAVVRAAGGTLADVVQVRVYLMDMAWFADVNAVYAEYFTESLPARAAIGVAGLPKGADVEMEAVVWLPGAVT